MPHEHGTGRYKTHVSGCCGATADDFYQELKRCPDCKESCEIVDADTYFEDGTPVILDADGIITEPYMVRTFPPVEETIKDAAGLIAIVVGLVVFYGVI